MATVAYFLAPVLVLFATWALLRAYDDRDRRLLRLGLGSLAAAVVLTAVGIGLDPQEPAPTTTPAAPASTA